MNAQSTSSLAVGQITYTVTYMKVAVQSAFYFGKFEIRNEFFFLLVHEL